MKKSTFYCCLLLAIVIITSLASCSTPKQDNDEAIASLKEDVRLLRETDKLDKERDSLILARELRRTQHAANLTALNHQ